MKEFIKENLNNKTVILRLDVNVPIKDGKVVDNTRLIASLPTLLKLLEMKAKVVIISHLGRPKGKIESDLSLKPVYHELEKHLLNVKLIFVKNIEEAKAAKDFQVMMLENIRFYNQEEQGSDEFAKELASLGEYFINDAFSCCHRAHTSISYINKYLPSAPGLLLIKEVEELTRIFKNPLKPFTSIIGGGKISSKIDILKSLLTISDNLLIGGAMANTFLKAMGNKIGISLVEDKYIETAKNIMETAKSKNCNIILPVDGMVADKNKEYMRHINLKDIKDNESIYDIGNMTLQSFKTCLQSSASVIWNGPLGMIEEEEFSHGSIEIAKAIAELTNTKKLYSVAGGGDVVTAINMANVFDKFSYISTAGGAFLEWIEGKELPGIEALKR